AVHGERGRDEGRQGERGNQAAGPAPPHGPGLAGPRRQDRADQGQADGEGRHQPSAGRLTRAVANPAGTPNSTSAHAATVTAPRALAKRPRPAAGVAAGRTLTRPSTGRNIHSLRSLGLAPARTKTTSSGMNPAG